MQANTETKPASLDRAVVYCHGAFGTTTGKTAHGLVRRGRRYQIVAVIDGQHAGRDAGMVLDDKPNGIPIVTDLNQALHQNVNPTHFVIGIATDGGRMDESVRAAVREAVSAGLHVDSGLHDFLCDDASIVSLAKQNNVQLRDVRKTQDRSRLHFYSGKIQEVTAYRVAVLGTDSAVGKRTTAWALVDGLISVGLSTELVGTGQTAWLQGARYGITLDALVNDFVAGELEHAVWSAWRETGCQAIVIEGQGSLMHPAYPGGFEILAACRPDAVVMQHAPGRKEYDGFPGSPIAPLAIQIAAVQLISGKPVVAITINPEGLRSDEVAGVCRNVSSATGLPTCNVLVDGPGPIVAALLKHMSKIR